MSRTKRTPFRFILLVFAISLPFWLLGYLVDGLFPRSIPIHLPFSAAMFVCPIMVAWILVYRAEGPSGVRALFKRVFDFGRISNKIWLLPTFGLMVVFVALTETVKKVLGVPLPALQVWDGMVPLSFVLFFIGAIGEELGWMGYAIDPLQERWGAFGAGLFLGVVWAVWHIIPFFQTHNPSQWILWQCLFTVATRIVMVWLYNNTGKSIFVAIVYHAMLNVVSVVLPNYGLPYDPFLVGLLVTLTAAAVVWLWGPKTLSQYRFAKPGQPDRQGQEYAGD